MKYDFPIKVNMRSLLPSVEQLFSSIEGNFNSFTGDTIKLTCHAPIMHFVINTPAALSSDQIKLAHATLMPLLLEKFPNSDVEIGDPEITGDPAFENYEFNAAHRVAQLSSQQKQDTSGFDIDDAGDRIDSDHNMFLKQDLCAQHGQCAECGEPLTERGTCSSGCIQTG